MQLQLEIQLLSIVHRLERQLGKLQITTTVNQLDLIDSKGTSPLTAEYTLFSNAQSECLRQQHSVSKQSKIEKKRKTVKDVVDSEMLMLYSKNMNCTNVIHTGTHSIGEYCQLVVSYYWKLIAHIYTIKQLLSKRRLTDNEITELFESASN